MHCLIFGYGYMGRIRYRALKDHPAVTRISVVDPAMDPKQSGLGGELHDPAAIRWNDIDAVKQRDQTE